MNKFEQKTRFDKSIVYPLSRWVEIVGWQVALIEESYAAAKGQYDAGLIPEVRVLRSDEDLTGSKNELQSTQLELAPAENALRPLLGVPTEDEIAPVGERSPTIPRSLIRRWLSSPRSITDNCFTQISNPD